MKLIRVSDLEKRLAPWTLKQLPQIEPEAIAEKLKMKDGIPYPFPCGVPCEINNSREAVIYVASYNFALSDFVKELVK